MATELEDIGAARSPTMRLPIDAGTPAAQIKMSGQPPFPAQLILNGHEYVAA
jgi:hypothetical protein